jgi:hypothetical protein
LIIKFPVDNKYGVSHLLALKQSSLQHDTAKDRHINTSTTSSKPSVIDVDSYELNCKKMRYAIFIINWEFDDQETLPFHNF